LKKLLAIILERFVRLVEKLDKMVDKQEVKDSIISAARSIFSKYGFKKTTMDDIARAMRKGKSSIYYYFTSKEEIYQAVVEKESLLLKVSISSSIDLVESPKDKLKNYIFTRMTTYSKLANFYNAIKDEYLSHLAFIDNIRKKYDNDEINMVQEILRDGVNRNVFKIEDTYLAATAIVTAMKGLEIPLFWENNDRRLEDRQQDLLNILFYGIVKQ